MYMPLDRFWTHISGLLGVRFYYCCCGCLHGVLGLNPQDLCLKVGGASSRTGPIWL